MVTGDEGENPALLVVKARSLYTSEAQWLGLRGIVMATGARGEVWEGWGGEELVTWPVSSLSGWDLLALETARLLHTSPLGDCSCVCVFVCERERERGRQCVCGVFVMV